MESTKVMIRPMEELSIEEIETLLSMKKMVLDTSKDNPSLFGRILQEIEQLETQLLERTNKDDDEEDEDEEEDDHEAEDEEEQEQGGEYVDRGAIFSDGEAGVVGAVLLQIFSRLSPPNQFHNQKTAIDWLIEALPDQLAESLRRHKTALSIDRSPLDSSTDPSEILRKFFSGLNGGVRKGVRRLIKKGKGFEEGKISTDSVKKIIRGNPYAEGLIYLWINLSTGMEYVGKAEHSLLVKTQQHFRSAFVSNSYSTEYRAGQSELNQAIRCSVLQEWRVVVLEMDVPIEKLSQRKNYFIQQYNTFWPKGYNIKRK